MLVEQVLQGAMAFGGERAVISDDIAGKINPRVSYLGKDVIKLFDFL